MCSLRALLRTLGDWGTRRRLVWIALLIAALAAGAAFVEAGWLLSLSRNVFIVKDILASPGEAIARRQLFVDQSGMDCVLVLV